MTIIAAYAEPLSERGWEVFGVVRNPDCEKELTALGKGVTVLVESLEDVKKASDAQKLINKVKPDYVVWSAGWDFRTSSQLLNADADCYAC